MKQQKVLYYSDPVNDDFAGNNIDTQQVPEDFVYVRKTAAWRICAFLLYYLIAVPVVWLIAKLCLGVKIENKGVLRGIKGGFYLYANHTRELDIFAADVAVLPRRGYVIANPDAVSIPGLRHIVMMLGALPIPSGLHTMKKFTAAVHERFSQGSCVIIYPEAHIWPFYTGIRPFADTSFRYPVRDKAPAVVMTVTYRKRKGLFALAKKPAMTLNLSGPLYPDAGLQPKQAQRDLRDRVYECMKETSELTAQVEYIRYEFKPDRRSSR